MLHTETRLPRSPVFGALEEFRKADSSYYNILPLVYPDYLTSSNMTPEQIAGCKVMEKRMQSVCSALEELLVAAQKDDRLTMGIYESAKLLNADPDSVVLCVLASDDHEDIGLQIHYTLLRSFCCDSNITILRVVGVQRLRRLLGRRDTVADIVDTDGSPGDDQGDLNCLLVTDPHADHLRLQEVGTYCTESRRHGQWLPELVLEER